MSDSQSLPPLPEPGFRVEELPERWEAVAAKIGSKNEFAAGRSFQLEACAEALREALQHAQQADGEAVAPHSTTDSVAEAQARTMYTNWCDEQDDIHCNRFPAWAELSQTERSKWLDRVVEPDTGVPEVDNLIGRLMSSDPSFEDCTDGAAMLRKLAIRPAASSTEQPPQAIAWTVKRNPGEDEAGGEAYDVMLPSGQWWTCIAVGPEDARAEAQKDWEQQQNELRRYAAPDASAASQQGGVPDGIATKAQRVLRMRADLAAFDGDRRGILDALRKAEEDLLETVLAATPSTAGAEPIVPPPDAQRFEPSPPDPNGCRPLRHLTEQEVRWIVREEIAAIERERVAAQEGKPS